MDYTVIWGFGQFNSVDYVGNITNSMNVEEMVRQAILQNIGYWEDTLENDFGGNIDDMLNSGYTVYAILEGHPKVLY